MALIDEVKAVCDRLAPLGWRDRLLSVTGNTLDIAQSTNAKLMTALTAVLPGIDRTQGGFEDFQPTANQAITGGSPARSLLYHLARRSKPGAAGSVQGGHSGAIDDDFVFPVHKLFAGKECLKGQNLTVNFHEFHRNEKLKKTHRLPPEAEGGLLALTVSTFPNARTSGTRATAATWRRCQPSDPRF